MTSLTIFGLVVALRDLQSPSVTIAFNAITLLVILMIFISVLQIASLFLFYLSLITLNIIARRILTWVLFACFALVIVAIVLIILRNAWQIIHEILVFLSFHVIVCVKHRRYFDYLESERV